MAAIRTRITSFGVKQERVEGQAGSLSIEVDANFVRTAKIRQQYTQVSGSIVTVAEDHLGKMIEVDPAGSTTTIALSGSIVSGFYCMIRQVNSGTVSFSSPGGVSIFSTAGSTPSINGQWGHVTIDKRNSTDWIVAGDIA